MKNEESHIAIPRPTMAPFGIEITAEGIQEIWNTFVKPEQDEGFTQSVEMRMLMGVLRAVYQGMTQEKGTDERVYEWAVERYCSGTSLDNDRRMVAAETEAFLSGRGWEETAELVKKAKEAYPLEDDNDD